jgi:beta-galactosidase GanA
VELTTRTAGGKRWIFLLNHTADPQTVDLARGFSDVLSRQTLSGKVSLEAYGVRILQA